MTDPAIPLVDLGAQHREIAAEVEAGFAAVMGASSYILGPQVAAFEREFAQFCGATECVGVGNGTDALELVLRACDVGAGDEVIVPANTFIATALAVVRAGATPVLVDCDEHHLMSVEQVEAAITPRTRALLPVHLYGQCADVEALGVIAERHGLLLLEDAAQSQGARRHGRRSGALAVAAATSFYPGKNLGAYGDAGAVTTGSSAVAARVRQLRNWGSERKYEHPVIGFNSRLDTLQAVVLSAKLRRLDGWNEARRRAAAAYTELLAGLDGVALPAVLPGNEHVWHLYVVLVPERDAVLAALHSQGIGAGIHYPTPLHLHGALEYLGYRPGAFPRAESLARRALSLPLHPHLTAAQVERVAGALRHASSGTAARAKAQR
jgi:dTDP-4-amino-4,6-dideoxygalactose transaminase